MASTRVVRSRGAWQQLLVRALTALCLSSQLAGVLHFALVRHARCAAHGELVHAGEHQVRGALLARRASSGPCYEADSPASGEHAQHEHCVASAERRVHTASAACRVSPPIEPVRSSAAIDEQARDPLARARWLLAPKSSPPA
jgi:hypothetical protein